MIAWLDPYEPIYIERGASQPMQSQFPDHLMDQVGQDRLKICEKGPWMLTFNLLAMRAGYNGIHDNILDVEGWVWRMI